MWNFLRRPGMLAVYALVLVLWGTLKFVRPDPEIALIIFKAMVAAFVTVIVVVFLGGIGKPTDEASRPIEGD